MFRILVIDVGSTSLKIGLFTDEKPLFKETVDYRKRFVANLTGTLGLDMRVASKVSEEQRCSTSEGARIPGEEGQREEEFSHFLQWIGQILQRHGEAESRFDLIVSRGGLTRPLRSGAYLIDEAMCRELRVGRYGWHPSNLGPLLAYEIGSRGRVPAIVFDSPVSDEMEAVARVSGLKGIERRAAFHVLSQKAAGRKAARALGNDYEDINLIIAHLGGGITVCAHRKGRIIDGNHGLSEGLFTPQRAGGLPVEAVVELCFSGRFETKERLKACLFNRGGVISYLGTHDIPEIEARIRSGDQEAELVLRAMCYQIGKEMGAMAAVLKGRVDGIVLTGNMAYSSFLVKEIEPFITFLAPVYVFPGDDELENLASGGLEVLKGGNFSSVRRYGVNVD